MSRRTTLIILAIFLVLLGIPIGYLALTWHPASPLTFRLEKGEPTVGNDNKLGGYRARHVRIDNSSLSSIEFHSAIILDTGGAVAFRDAPPGMVLTETANGVPSNSHVLLILAHGHLVADAVLMPALLDEVEKGRESVFVQYQWQSHSRSRADSAVRWLAEHGPTWAKKYISRFALWEDAVPLRGGQ